MPSPTLPSLFRPCLRLLAMTLALALIFAAAPAVHASTITYQMTFTSGSYSGTGTLMLASQPATSGVTSDTVANQQIQQLIFTLGDQTWNFSTDPSASVQFVNGQISQINFGQALSQTPAGYTLALSNGFSLYGTDLSQPLFSGTYNVTDNSASSQPAATGPTPEPGSLLLLTTALLGGGFLIFRRTRRAHS